MSSPPPLPPPLPRPRSFASLSGSAGGGPPKAHDDDDACPTCLDEWSADNPACPLPCGHAFHLACVLEWSQRASSCPVCGARVDAETLLAGSHDDGGGVSAPPSTGAASLAHEESAVFYDARSAVASDSDAGEDDATFTSQRTSPYRRD